MLSIETINTHLHNQHPSDPACQLAIKKLSYEQWGHWSFIATPINPAQSSLNVSPKKCVPGFFVPRDKLSIQNRALEYLSLIRELHRLTLELYFIRQNLVRAATVANVFGEVWIYGDPVGKVVLAELLNSVSDVTTRYHEKFHEFWQKYFVEHYTTQAKYYKEDDFTHECHVWLNLIDQTNKISINNTVNSIEEVISKIREQAFRLPEIKDRAKQTKKELFMDLLAFLKYRGKTNTTNYGIIHAGLLQLEIEQQTTKEQTEADSLIDKAMAEKGLQLKIQEAIDVEVRRQMRLFSHHFLEQTQASKVPLDAAADNEQEVLSSDALIAQIMAEVSGSINAEQSHRLASESMQGRYASSDSTQSPSLSTFGTQFDSLKADVTTDRIAHQKEIDNLKQLLTPNN